MPDLASVLRAQGCSVVEHGAWKQRGRPGPFAPTGIMVHHTAGSKAGDSPSLKVCIEGRGDTPGPLCQLLLGRDGRWHVIAAGRANHAGKGSGVVLRDTRANKPPSGDAGKRKLSDDTDGNTHFVGIEIENDGRGERYPELQLAALERGLAALCRAYRWSPARVVAHREWTRRKIDPRGIDMRSLRARIATILRPRTWKVLHADGSGHASGLKLDEALKRARVLCEREGGAIVRAS